VIGFWVSLLEGFVIAAALFAALLALVVWLYRLSFGHTPRLPIGRTTVETYVMLGVFGAILAAAVINLFRVTAPDYAFWQAYTLPKNEVIDYVIAFVLFMPSLFWFGASLMNAGPATAPAPADEEGDQDHDAAEAESPEAESPEEEPGESADTEDEPTPSSGS
jgi:hypothetical protein